MALACSEFDHWDETKHNVELRFGAANVLSLLLAITQDEDEIRMTCSAMEMVFRGSASSVHAAFEKVGSNVVTKLLQIMNLCEKNKMKHSDVTIFNITKTLTYFSRIPELRGSLVHQHSRMMSALVRTTSTALTPDNRTCRMRLIANLANCDENKVHFLETPGLLEAILRIAALDLTDAAREYASTTLMDLASSSQNQFPWPTMASCWIR